MKEAPNSPYNKLVFRETFSDEQSVRRNGGVPTDVTISNGIGSFNGTSSGIVYPKNFNGTYSIRIRFKEPKTFSSSQYLCDFRQGTGVGYVYCSETTIAAPGSTKYANGVASTSSIAVKEIVVSGITITSTEMTMGRRTPPYTSYFNGDLELFEIYEGTLTASEVKNLYRNSWAKELVSSNLLLDYDSTNGYITDRTGKNTLTLSGTEAVNIVKNGSYYAQSMTKGFKQVLDSNIINEQPITVVYWANYNTIALNTRIMDNGNFFIDGTSGNRLRIRSDGSSSGFSPTNFIVPGKTQFIAITRDATGLVTFYSGDKFTAPTLSGTASTGTPAVTSTPLTLFGASTSDTSGFDGRMVRCQVYNGILDLEQLTQIWSSTRGKIE